MLLPRHIESKKKNKINYTLLFILLTILSLFGTIIWKWKDILIFFSGNSKLKVQKVEDKILDGIKKGNFSKNLVSDFQSVVNSYYDAFPTNPSANFYISKYYYYEFYTKISKLGINEVIKLNSIGGKVSNLESVTENPNFEVMYRVALRARAFNASFSESDQNSLLILLYETLDSKIKKETIVNELSLIDSEKLPADFQKLFYFIQLLVLPKSGEIEKFDTLVDSNNFKNNFKLDPREINFLRAVCILQKKELVKSLELFRSVKKDLDTLTIEATRYEASIFSHQNLYDKALILLETLFEDTGSTNESIKNQIRVLLSTKPGLKTKINLE